MSQPLVVGRERRALTASVGAVTGTAHDTFDTLLTRAAERCTR